MVSKIEWTDESWNPVIGCTKVSAGCQNCYAERMAARLNYMGQANYGSVIDDNCKWNNKVVCLGRDVLNKPLHWRKPRRIFVCSMSDLFHPKVPFEFIDQVMQIITMYPQQHIFQVLTKRVKRMLEYFKQLHSGLTKFHKGHDFQWPFKNLWLGVTCENQKTADERIPILLQIPAAVRFLSLEPLLGEIYLPGPLLNHGFGFEYYQEPGKIGWAIIGCESGPNRREYKTEWVRDLVRQCKVAGVPVFVKQLNINGKVEHDISKFPKDLQIRQYPERINEMSKDIDKILNFIQNIK